MKGELILESWREIEDEILNCRRCPRLVAWREEVARVRRRAYRDQEYWGRPITGFGDRQARLLVVGLAPGAHGANRTGRVFTGDGSGSFLFKALHAAGFANQPTSTHAGDGLELCDVYISAVCRCAPPENKPTREEIETCLPFLEREMALLNRAQVVVALGKIAFDYLVKIYRGQGYALPRLDFMHGAVYRLAEWSPDESPGGPVLIASYHPSRQNTQTGRLTEAMFAEIWQQARRQLQ